MRSGDLGPEFIEGCRGHVRVFDDGGNPVADCLDGGMVCVRAGASGLSQVGNFPPATCGRYIECHIQNTVGGDDLVVDGPEVCLCGCELP